jgi:hypothetical protein
MVIRLLISASLLATITLLGVFFGGSSDPFRPAPVSAAPANTTVDGLTFSHGITSDAQPVDPDIEYHSGENKVWVSFGYSNHDPNTEVTYLVRINGDTDYNWGRLDCCSGSSGHFAFPIERKNGNGGALAGASYDVFVYVNGTQVAEGGFGVKGKQGQDNGDPGNNGGKHNDNN